MVPKEDDFPAEEKLQEVERMIVTKKKSARTTARDLSILRAIARDYADFIKRQRRPKT